MRTIRLQAVDRTVSLGAYVRAVKLAKAHPLTEFKQGLDSWWPTTGADILRQFHAAMHDRINQSVPYTNRGT